MATDKPRITISLDPHVYATIKRMSELAGEPMSRIISDLLDTVHDPFMRTVALLEAASEAPKQVRDGLRKSVEAVERDLYKAAGHSLEQMDWLMGQLGASAPRDFHEAVSDAAGGSGAEAETLTRARAKRSNPRNVIRGSGSTRSSSKKSGRPL